MTIAVSNSNDRGDKEETVKRSKMVENRNHNIPLHHSLATNEDMNYGKNTIDHSILIFPSNRKQALCWLVMVLGGILIGLSLSMSFYNSSSSSSFGLLGLERKQNTNIVVVDESQGGQLYYTIRDLDIILSTIQRACDSPSIQIISSSQQLLPSSLISWFSFPPPVDLLLCLAMVDPEGVCDPSMGGKYSTIQTTLIRKISTIPHFRNTLWRKDSLCSITSAMMKENPDLPFIPCIILKPPVDGWKAVDSATKGVVDDFMREPYDDVKSGHSFPFIVKPTQRGEGKGIFTVSSSQEIWQVLRNSGDQLSHFVVSPMLMNPFTVNYRKVDLRCYVLVSLSSSGQYQARLYWDCIVRVALDMFSKTAKRGGKKTQWMTNTYLSRTEAGSDTVDVLILSELVQHLQDQISGDEFVEELRSQGGSSMRNNRIDEFIFDPSTLASLYSTSVSLMDLQQRVIAVILPVLVHALGKMAKRQPGSDANRFHLLGVDLFLDNELGLKLIEWNGLPSMSTSIENVTYRQLKKELWESVINVIDLCDDAPTLPSSTTTRWISLSL
eukprot:m.4876 g.4876  ORF g.4876 m.4876 type:complete len:554 (+) comp2306_c0_seq1:122-1783(+)